MSEVSKSSHRPAKNYFDYTIGLRVESGVVRLGKNNGFYLLIAQPPLDEYEAYHVSRLLDGKVKHQDHTPQASLYKLGAESFSRYYPEKRDMNAILFANEFAALLGNRIYDGNIFEKSSPANQPPATEQPQSADQ